MNAVGFLHAEDLLADLGGTRLWTTHGEGAMIAEWVMPRGRVTLSQGPDGRLRLYGLAAEADRIKPDALLDAIVRLHQDRDPGDAPRTR